MRKNIRSKEIQRHKRAMRRRKNFQKRQRNISSHWKQADDDLNIALLPHENMTADEFSRQLKSILSIVDKYGIMLNEQCMTVKRSLHRKVVSELAEIEQLGLIIIDGFSFTTINLEDDVSLN